MKLLKTLQKFFHLHYVPGKPLLLGLSGGTDSLALLYLLLEVKKDLPFELHVAHVDHGWREESREEALQLQALSESLKLPFYAERLETVPDSNKEEVARDFRLQFFKKIYAQGFQSLILAHQADDQAETLLKRVLEGAHLLTLGGIRAVSDFEGMRIWRPLLSVPKSELQLFLDKRSLEGFDDATNRDPVFLRARMRTQIFPELERSFGKKIGSNLCRLGTVAEELNDYFCRKLTPYLEFVQRTESGWSLDCTQLHLERLELKFLFKLILSQEKLFLSHQSFEALLNAVLDKKNCKTIQRLYIHSGVVNYCRN